MTQRLKSLTHSANDARGRPVTILDPVKIYLLRPITKRMLNRPESIPESELRSIAEELDPYWTRRGWLIFAVYAVGLALCYAGNLFYRFYVSSSPGWDLIGMLFPIAQFVLMFGAFYATWVVGKRARRPRVVPIMLKHRRCPHCGYDMRDLTPDEKDGATVCPECGCAWAPDDENRRSPDEQPKRSGQSPGKRR
jgi:hypothetical protein